MIKFTGPFIAIFEINDFNFEQFVLLKGIDGFKSILIISNEYIEKYGKVKPDILLSIKENKLFEDDLITIVGWEESIIDG